MSAWRVDPAKSQVASEVASLYASAGGTSVIGARGLRAQPAIAALANGMLANAADNDDTHKRALLHTGSVVVPTVLALAETERLSGRDLLLALVAGYEVAVRVGMAVMPSHYRFWHSTGTNGTFGAAAAAAKAFRLDIDRTRTALGLAGTQTAGLNTFFVFPARVTIELSGGNSFQETVLFPKGDPEDPLSPEELDAKFHDNARDLLGRERAGSLLAAIYALPGAKSVDDAVSLLHP